MHQSNLSISIHPAIPPTSTHPAIHLLPAQLSACLSLLLSVHAPLSIYLSIYLSIFQSFYHVLSFFLSFLPSFFLSFFHSFFLPIKPSIYLSLSAYHCSSSLSSIPWHKLGIRTALELVPMAPPAALGSSMWHVIRSVCDMMFQVGHSPAGRASGCRLMLFRPTCLLFFLHIRHCLGLIGRKEKSHLIESKNTSVTIEPAMNDSFVIWTHTACAGGTWAPPP